MSDPADLEYIVRPHRVTPKLWSRLRCAGPDRLIDVMIIVHHVNVRSYDGNGWTDRPAGEYLKRYLELQGRSAEEDLLFIRAYHARLTPALIRTLATQRHVERLQLDVAH